MDQNTGDSLINIEKSSKKNVYLCIEFHRVGQIDMMNEVFQATVNIYASWEVDKIIEEFVESKEWTPSLYIENLVDEKQKKIQYKIEKIGEKNATKVTQITNVNGKI
jgi:ribosome-interacting GTPase 1